MKTKEKEMIVAYYRMKGKPMPPEFEYCLHEELEPYDFENWAANLYKKGITKKLFLMVQPEECHDCGYEPDEPDVIIYTFQRKDKRKKDVNDDLYGAVLEDRDDYNFPVRLESLLRLFT